MAGKAPVFLANGNLYDDTAEVIQLTYGKNVKISGYWGQITEQDSGYMADKAYGASLSGKIGRLDLAAGYDRFEDLDAGFTKISNNAVWNAGANYNFGDFILGAMYLNSDISDKAVEKGADTDGFVISAAYKGAKVAKQGTWGLWGNYYDQGAGTFIAHTMKAGDWGYFTKEGFKGYGVGINYTLAKNMVYNLDYYDLEGKESGRDSQIIWNRLQVAF